MSEIARLFSGLFEHGFECDEMEQGVQFGVGPGGTRERWRRN